MTSINYKDFDGIREAIKEARGAGMTYEMISKLYGVSAAWVWNVERGIFPKRADIRLAFGVEPMAVTAEMFNEMKTCQKPNCSGLFIPNHPKRMYCFKCIPYRGKERGC